MASKYALLRLIDYSSNHAKEYEMIQINANQFEAKYGRIGAAKQSKTYSMAKWHEVYDSKVRKGYQDVTPFVPTPLFNKTEENIPLAPKVKKVVLNDNLLSIANNISGCVVEEINEDIIEKCINLLKYTDTLTKENDKISSYANIRILIPQRQNDKEDDINILILSATRDVEIFKVLLKKKKELENPNLSKDEKNLIERDAYKEMRKVAREYAF